MAGATELPEVTQKWVANVTEYVAAMEEMLRATRDVAEEVIELQAEIDALHGRDIRIGFDTAATGATAAAAAVNDLTRATYEETAARDAALRADLAGTEATISEAAAYKMVTASMGDAAKAMRAVRAADEALAFADKAAGDAALIAVGGLNASTAAADKSGAAATRAYRPWFLFGNNWKTALHWIVAGGAEFLAVTIPAAVALGAGLLVAAQGAQNAQEHFTALYGATEATANMFHTTVGDTLGLGHALQSAQNAANPGVYELLGSALNDARTGFSGLANVGLQVVHMWDEFAAKITVNLKNGGAAQIGGLLSGMVKDLDQLGQVLGNVGHALLNFAAAMPGLVHILLDVADGVSKLILWISKIPAPIITAVMAIEEFYRWGGLLLGLFARLAGASALATTFAEGGGFIAKFGGSLKALMVTVGKVIPAVGELGALAGPGLLAGLALGVGAVGAMIFALSRMKTATEEWIASSQKAISEARNMQVLSTIGSQMSQNSQKIAQMSHLVAANTQEFNKNALAARYLNDSYNQTSHAVTELNSNQVQMVHQVGNVVGGAHAIMQAYGVSFPAALAMADQAGVHLANNMIVLGKHANVAGQMIMNLVTGLRAMGQPMGAVGQDMTALAIQSGLASTKVSQLNQAWDQFMQNLVGGTSGLSSFVTSLQNIGSGVAHVTQNLGQGGGFSQSMGQFANDLRNFGKNGAQAWQNFDQVVGSTAPQLIDWFRTAGAEGAMSGKQFQQGVLAMVSSLVPLASKSKTAQAEVLGLVQQAGLGIHTWPQISAAIKDNGAKTGDLGKIVGDVTQKMSNMGQVAQNLGTVMNSALTTAISNAALKAAGFYTQTSRLTQALQRYGANSPQAEAAARAVTAAWDRAQAMAGRVAQQAHNAQSAIDAMHGKTLTITTNLFTVGHAPTGIFGPNPVMKQHGGVIPGYQPGVDSVHAMLSPGEGILNPYAVRMLGAGWVHAVNSMAERGGSFNPASLRTGGAGGGGGGSGNVMLKVYLDGKEMFGNNKVQVLNYNTRNSGGRTGKWIPS